MNPSIIDISRSVSRDRYRDMQEPQRRRSSDDNGSRSAAAGFHVSQRRAKAGTMIRPSASAGAAASVDIYSFVLATSQLPAAAKQCSGSARQTPAGKRLFGTRSQPSRLAATAPLDAAAARPQRTVTIKQRQAPASPFACVPDLAAAVAAQDAPSTGAPPTDAASSAARVSSHAQSADSPTAVAVEVSAAVSPASGGVADQAPSPQQQQSDARGAFISQLARLGAKGSA